MPKISDKYAESRLRRDGDREAVARAYETPVLTRQMEGSVNLLFRLP
jgi:hypothetical protein